MGDWVIQDETWRNYEALSGGVNYYDQTIGDPHLSYPLTSWLDDGGGSGRSESYRMVEQGNMVAHQTRGHIHWMIAPTNLSGSWAAIFGQDWAAEISFRISVGAQQVDTLSVSMPSSYDLHTAPAANDEYAWERKLWTLNVSQDEWNGSPAARTRLYGTIPVVAKYKRHLAPPYVMALHVGFDQVTFASAWLQDQTDRLQLYWRPELRTYATTS